MSRKSDLIVRVIDVVRHADQAQVIVMAGDVEYQLTCGLDAAPQLGDVFVAKGGADAPIILQQKIGAATQWRGDGDAMRWRKRNASGRSRMQALKQRQIIRRAVRDYLYGEDFIEIDTPLLVCGTTPDVCINSFALGDRYLISSSEYQIKRMEIGGFDRLYTLTQNYRRDDGAGTTRNPEFTMLEWARVGGSLRQIENDVEQFTLAAHRALGGDGFITYQGHRVNLQTPWRRMSVAEVVAEQLGVGLTDFSIVNLHRALAKTEIALKPEWAEDQAFLFSLLMDYLQDRLGFGAPLFVGDWPAFSTASTIAKGETQPAERSELFIAGVEISDGFPTLTDAARQRENFQHQQKRRQQSGMEAVAEDAAYLAAMLEGLPQGAGMALGFDRLCMVLGDWPNIRSVLAYGWDEC